MMKMLLGAVLLSLSAAAFADGVLRTPDLLFVFKEAPCTSPEVLAFLKPEFHSQFKQAAVQHQGRNIAACWIVGEDHPNVIYLKDADGESVNIPRKAVTFDAAA